MALFLWWAHHVSVDVRTISHQTMPNRNLTAYFRVVGFILPVPVKFAFTDSEVVKKVNYCIIDVSV